MLKPRKYNAHYALMEKAGLKEEQSWLVKNYNIYGSQSDEYTKRAKKYNAKCIELGATLVMQEV